MSKFYEIHSLVEDRMRDSTQCFFDEDLPENHPFGCYIPL